MKRFLSALCLVSVMCGGSGCATMEQTDQLEYQVNWLRANIRDRDRHIQSLEQRVQQQQAQAQQQQKQIKRLNEAMVWGMVVLGIMMYQQPHNQSESDEIK